jgi:septal ring factor EnvC (AmiA/AmiB activator)
MRRQLRFISRRMMPVARADADLRRAGAAALACAGAFGMAAGAIAEPAPPRPLAQVEQPADPEALQQRGRELEAIRAEQKKATEIEAALRAEIATLGEDRRKLNQDLIDTATRLRNVEERIGETEARVRPLDDSETATRQSLERRRGIIIEILAALQRIGRRPPPAILVRPEDALQSVRTAMMLGAVLPEMRSEAETLVAELGELVRVRREIAIEREQLTRDLAALLQERRRMTLLVEERQKKQADTEKALEAERQRAGSLAAQVNNLRDLIAKLEQNLASAARAARSAARSDDESKQRPADARPTLAALSDPGRLAPAIAFASAKGLLRLPVSGVRTREFGAADGLGGIERGLSIATRAGAQVTAPCDGWVVYSGPFRSYGQLLILNAGGGYHVVLAGMNKVSVNLGQFVLTGEPVAVMGDGPPGTSVRGASSSQPVLYVEFRKDGTPVDPSPWWARSDSEKVRG